eukprot:13082658-Heterocapsa_arctica.AAC.1
MASSASRRASSFTLGISFMTKVFHFANKGFHSANKVYKVLHCANKVDGKVVDDLEKMKGSEEKH